MKAILSAHAVEAMALRNIELARLCGVLPQPLLPRAAPRPGLGTSRGHVGQGSTAVS
jgi:hypothetical protein